MLHRALAGRNGLSSKVKMAVYKQIVRPTMAYAFPIWYGISSHQMELIRILERKTLAYCLDLRNRRTEQGHYIAPSLRSIYEGAETKRIDRFMTETAIQQLRRCTLHANALVRECAVTQQNFENIVNTGGQISPMCLLHFYDGGMLFGADDRLIFYHRRYRTYNFESLVYRTDQ